MWRKAVAFGLFSLLPLFTFGQSTPLVTYEGTVVTYIHKSALYPRKNVIYMDFFPGHTFFFRDSVSCNLKERLDVFELKMEKSQAVFFYHDCPLVFDVYFEDWGVDTSRLKVLDASFYPTKYDFSFKKRGFIFKCSSVKIICKPVLLPLSVVRSSAAYHNLDFSTSMVPSLFVYEIVRVDE